ncbi:MAG: 1-(5-phosphoribosyl)-5-[(5-phosphoribosylamino)methylideneamino]imidazole-4-carboxamide isomerase [Candidatus Hinthialibacter antarcticus]|nr:1-(5-phosphoribosyl)-5-[(5-phosphoribosylamino)methylideneamino]imidazole-4-carboxamide isomerase [Candidatus Hinthialibacter antarcticus]
MIDLIPAIDLRGGNAVRLLRGEYDQETIYSNNPAEFAKTWQDGGGDIVHIVDLDGARDGAMQNRDAIRAIVETLSIKTELGGGLRDMEAVHCVLGDLGVDRAILGSVLLEKPDFAREAAQAYPGRIILGIDARDGLVATRGWRETSQVKAVDLVKEFAGLDYCAVIYTDIARDGTLVGPNLEQLAEMAAASPFPIIASGGIGSLDDIRNVVKLANTLEQGSISGVIVGKALYEKKFTIEEAAAAMKA